MAWLSKNKTQKSIENRIKKEETNNHSDSLLIEDNSILTAENNLSENKIVIEKLKPKIVFKNNSLIEKNKKLNFRIEKYTLSRVETKLFIGLFLGLIALVALIFYYSVLLPWMIALSVGLLLLALALIISDKKDGNNNAQTGVERKNSTKDNREIPLIATIAFIIQFLPFGFLLAIIFYIVAIHKIKSNPEKYRGMRFVIGGLFITIAMLLFWSFLILIVLGI